MLPFTNTNCKTGLLPPISPAATISVPDSSGGLQVSYFNDKALFVVLIREHDHAKVVLHDGCADTMLLLLQECHDTARPLWVYCLVGGSILSVVCVL
jgi:hypothetical protein